MASWIPADGSYSQRDNKYIVEGIDGDGSVELQASDCKVESGKLYVKEGATTSNRRFPSKKDESQRDPLRTRDTYCIGALEFRCSDDKLIGVCIGAWDCGG